MASSPTVTCPRCDAHRSTGPECPRCGVIYARARPLAAVATPAIPLPAAPAAPFDATEAQWEAKLRLCAIPAALLFAWLLVSTPMGGMLSRVFLSMWIHELGHAVTAWLCGFLAFPGPWFTSVAEVRSPLFSLVLSAMLAFLVFLGWTRRKPIWVTGAAAVLLLQAVGTLVLSRHSAEVLITFGGDGGCFVLGTALMATLYSSPDSALRRGWLRWGFLWIGAVAFMDAAHTWWGSAQNIDQIPFGVIEGIAQSDPTRLVEEYGWTLGQLSRRHIWLSYFCLLALGTVYVISVYRSREVLRQAFRGPSRR